MKNQKCPLCLMTIKSDAMLEKYCKLCGMGIEKDSKIFCCNKCLKKFKKNLKTKKIRGEKNEGNN
ncbi:MAG: hypothetical protein V1818_03285 [Candidatus Aenigmatarchaeota archaeon]